MLIKWQTGRSELFCLEVAFPICDVCVQLPLGSAKFAKIRLTF